MLYLLLDLDDEMGVSPFFVASIIDSLVQTIPEHTLQTINRVIESKDCHLVEAKLRGNEQRRILDLFIDNRDGVSLELCSEVSRALRDESANDKFLSDVYTLEVSSPGVDRPLTFNWQYDKHIGRLLRVVMVDGSIVLATLKAVDSDSIQILPQAKTRKQESSEVLSVPFERIKHSLVELQFK